MELIPCRDLSARKIWVQLADKKWEKYFKAKGKALGEGLALSELRAFLESIKAITEQG